MFVRSRKNEKNLIAYYMVINPHKVGQQLYEGAQIECLAREDKRTNCIIIVFFSSEMERQPFKVGQSNRRR